MNEDTLEQPEQINNKIVAYHKKNKYSYWYAAIECGEWNMIPARLDFVTNKDTNKTYKLYAPILFPPDNLKQWQEIDVETLYGCKVLLPEDSKYDQIEFQGWEKTEILTVKLLYEFKEKLKSFLKTTNGNITTEELESIFMGNFTKADGMANDEILSYVKYLQNE